MMLFKSLLPLLMCASAFAGTVTPVDSRLGFTDSFDWSTLGPEWTYVTSTTASTANGLGLTIGLNSAGPYSGYTMAAAGGWTGRFTDSDYLLYTWDYGPITIGFNSPTNGIVFQIESNCFGPFSSRITAYSGATELGHVDVSGTAGPDLRDGSNPYLGIASSESNITSVQIDGLTANGSVHDFAINRLSLVQGPTGGSVPEPATYMLLSFGLLTVAGFKMIPRRSR
jgi:hypothetical protein